MSLQRFFKFIRFDNKSESRQRLQSVKFTLVLAVWNKLIENSQDCFKPGECIIENEYLFPTKARYRFIQYKILADSQR